MDENSAAAGLVMEAVLLFLEGVEKPARYRGNGHKAAHVHAKKGTGQSARDKRCGKRANAVIDELSLKAPIYKGPLEPLVNGILLDQTPKNALMNTETSTRKRQEPPQPMISLLIS